MKAHLTFYSMFSMNIVLHFAVCTSLSPKD
uniref:Uncharacterized protein n=1 Tax=Rhizophora mucronata TaxID=61149 RepID=A0A2P2Q6Q1_RHIMU